MLIPRPTALAVIAIGAVVAVAGLYARRRARVMARWRCVRGEVTGTRVHVSAADPELSAISGVGVGVTYRYRVGGATYDGDTPAFRPHSVDGRQAEAEALAAAHPPGTAVSVYYDPADPARSTLEPPDPAGAGAAALLCGGLAVVAGILALLARP